MEMTKNQKILWVIIILTVAFSIFYFMRPKKGIINTNNSTTTPNQLVDELSKNNPGYTIEQVPIEPTKNNVPIPDLNRSVVFDTKLVFTDESKKAITDKVLSLQGQIKNDPSKLTLWIDLGMYQKMAGDYIGARDSWKYVSLKSPTDFISRGNLGFLYAYYLKDNAMAETYYKDAISKGPKQSYLYIQLAEVYRDVFKDIDKAKAIIDSGLKIMSTDDGLIEFKKNLN